MTPKRHCVTITVKTVKIQSFSFQQQKKYKRRNSLYFLLLFFDVVIAFGIIFAISTNLFCLFCSLSRSDHVNGCTEKNCTTHYERKLKDVNAQLKTIQKSLVVAFLLHCLFAVEIERWHTDTHKPIFF